MPAAKAETKKRKPSAKKGSAKKAAPAAKKGKLNKDGSVKKKRGKNAFMFFSMEIRPTVVKENPDLAFGEVGKEIGKRWAAVKDRVCL